MRPLTTLKLITRGHESSFLILEERGIVLPDGSIYLIGDAPDIFKFDGAVPLISRRKRYDDEDYEDEDYEDEDYEDEDYEDEDYEDEDYDDEDYDDEDYDDEDYDDEDYDDEDYDDEDYEEEDEDDLYRKRRR